MNMTPTQPISRRNDQTAQGRRVLDLAEGILIGLRRYPTEAAFAELLDVARRHDTTVSAAATVLVQIASSAVESAHAEPTVMLAVQREWTDLLRTHIQT